MNAIAPRIGQLIRLLGSDRDFEALAALRALQRSLASANLDFHWLADCADGADRRDYHRHPRSGVRWGSLRADERQELLGDLLASDELSPWEREFTESILSQLRAQRSSLQLSSKQIAVIERLAQKAGGAS